MRRLLFVSSITIFYPSTALSALSDHFVTTWKTDQVPPGTNYVAVPIFDSLGQVSDMTSAYI
jgi:hypothetical protein